MSCTELAPLLDLVPVGALDPDEQATLDTHLEACPACRAEADQLGRLYGALAAGVRAELLPPAPAQFEAILARLPAKPATPVEPAPEPAGLPVVLNCTFCRGSLGGAGSYCASCLAPHHEDCFARHGHCAAPGCRETQILQRKSAALPRRRSRFLPFLALAGLGLGVAAWQLAPEEPRPMPRPSSVSRTAPPPTAPGRPAPPRVQPVALRAGYPQSVGRGVDPWNQGYWPVEVAGLQRLEWSTRSGGRVGMPLPAGDGRVYAQTGGGGIHCFAAATGAQLWSGPGTSHTNYSSSVLGSDGASYGSAFHAIRCVEADGTLRWEVPLEGNWFHAPPALSPDESTLYLGADSVGLAALDARSGEIRWIRREGKGSHNRYCFDAAGGLLVGTPSSLEAVGPAGETLWSLAQPVEGLLAAGSLLVVHAGKGLYGIRPDTREVAWSVELPARICGIALSDAGWLAASTAGGELMAVDPSGRLLWSSRLSSGSLSAPATCAGGRVLVSDAENTLFLTGPAGRLLSSLKLGGEGRFWPPTVGPRGRVFVAGQQRLYCASSGAPVASIDGLLQERARTLQRLEAAFAEQAQPHAGRDAQVRYLFDPPLTHALGAFPETRRTFSNRPGGLRAFPLEPSQGHIISPAVRVRGSTLRLEIQGAAAVFIRQGFRGEAPPRSLLLEFQARGWILLDREPSPWPPGKRTGDYDLILARVCADELLTLEGAGHWRQLPTVIVAPLDGGSVAVEEAR